MGIAVDQALQAFLVGLNISFQGAVILSVDLGSLPGGKCAVPTNLFNFSTWQILAPGHQKTSWGTLFKYKSLSKDAIHTSLNHFLFKLESGDAKRFEICSKMRFTTNEAT